MRRSKKASEEEVAQEIYMALIESRKSTRANYSTDLAALLSKPDIYTIFLKLCFEFDSSRDLREVRKGLLFVIRSMNVTRIAAEMGLSRISLYRMLSKGGNPRLQNLVSLFQVLGLRLWTVEANFIRRRVKLAESLKRSA